MGGKRWKVVSEILVIIVVFSYDLRPSEVAIIFIIVNQTRSLRRKRSFYSGKENLPDDLLEMEANSFPPFSVRAKTDKQ